MIISMLEYLGIMVLYLSVWKSNVLKLTKPYMSETALIIVESFKIFQLSSMALQIERLEI